MSKAKRTSPCTLCPVLQYTRRQFPLIFRRACRVQHTMYLNTSLSLLIHAMWSSQTSLMRSKKTCAALAACMLDEPVALCVPLPDANEADDVEGGKTGTICLLVSDSKCSVISRATELYSV